MTAAIMVYLYNLLFVKSYHLISIVEIFMGFFVVQSKDLLCIDHASIFLSRRILALKNSCFFVKSIVTDSMEYNLIVYLYMFTLFFK